MKLVDRLILKEILGPWCFGIGLFSSLLMAGTYLNKIADWVVQGIPSGIILQLVLLLFPAILVKTFTMATLLAALLGFGRLSSDSELVALRAGGASVSRIVRPVTLFSVVIALCTFGFNEVVVPGAATRARGIMADIANAGGKRSGNPVAFPLSDKGGLRLYVVSKAWSGDTMQGVTVVFYDKTGAVSNYLQTSQMQWRPLDGRWRISGQSTILSADGRDVIRTTDIWPDDLGPSVTRTPTDIGLFGNNDPDLLSMREVQAQIQRGKELGDVSEAKLRNMEYWFWSKISVPLAAVIFGTLGAVLGIRNHRTGTASGFALAVAIIFAYVTMVQFLNVWAQGGVLPPWLASFAPILFGAIAAGTIMAKRNT